MQHTDDQSTETGSAYPAKGSRQLLVALMTPFLVIALNLSMFTVAQPAIRYAFGLRADTTSWIMTAYLLPYLMLMPLYGQWGDFIGKRIMLIIGICLYAVGTTGILLAPYPAFIFAGRVLQGIGGAAVNPMCLSIIMSAFPSDKRGSALGSWNAMGPLMGMIGPVLGGFLIDRWAWNAILPPLILISLASITVLLLFLPKERIPRGVRGMLRRFDWLGAGLLAGVITAAVFYLSSEVITGRPPLTDFRLLVIAGVFFVLFLVRERRYRTPFVPFDLFTHRRYSVACVGVSVRMMLLGSMNFLLPLYFTDLYNMPAAQIGMVLTFGAFALLVAMKFGGFLADSWSKRWPAVIGLGGQASSFALLAALPLSAPFWIVAAGGVLNGFAAGLSLVSLHRSALDDIPPGEVGTGAGIYSMIRFVGSLLGAALNGVILQAGIEAMPSLFQAYHRNFLIVAMVGLCGMLTTLIFNRQKNKQKRVQ